MRDLEESILKKNVPGKMSTWDNSKKDLKLTFEENDNGDGHSGDKDGAASSIELPQSNGHGYNTGAKGVIQDYKARKQFEKILNQKEEMQREETIRRMTEGTKLKPGEQSFSLSSVEQRKCQAKKTRKDNNDDDSHSGSSDDSIFDDEDESEILDSYRRMRLSELQDTALPTYFHVEELHDAQSFSEVIDDTESRMYCIFHLFDDDVKSCRLLHQYFDALARKMNHCRFFKIEASILFNQNLDSIGFPCVQIYKGGKEVANLTPIINRSQFSVEEIESLLHAHILKS